MPAISTPLKDIQEVWKSNEVRLERAREVVGALLFVMVSVTLALCIGSAGVQGYFFPLQRFQRLWLRLRDLRVSVALYATLNGVLCVASLLAGGPLFFIVFIGLLMLWAIGFVVYDVMLCCGWRLREGAVFVSPDTLSIASERTGRCATDGNISEHADVMVMGTGAASGARLFSPPDSHLTSTGSQLPLRSGIRRRLTKGAEHASNEDDQRPAKVRDPAFGVDVPWAAFPMKQSAQQRLFLWGSFGCATLSLLVLLIIFFSWQVPSYLLMDRRGHIIEEPMRSLGARGDMLLYSIPGFARRVHAQRLVALLSAQCGRRFSRPIRAATLQKQWIDFYNVDMNDFDPSTANGYPSIDSLLVRQVKISARPLPLDSRNAFVTPTDGRLLILEDPRDVLVELKRDMSSTGDLIDVGRLAVVNASVAEWFQHGDVSLVISRLSFGDSHQFFSPLSGSVVALYDVPGELWSNGMLTYRSGINPLMNSRKVLIIDLGVRLGYMAYVIVGASCKGVTELNALKEVHVGTTMAQGQLLGATHFGGSSVVLVVPRGRVTWDPMLLQRSVFGVETLVKARSFVGETL